MLGKVWLLLIKIDSHQLKIDRRMALQAHQYIKHRQGVLTTRDANHDLVALLDHIKVFDRSTCVTPQAFMQFILVVNRFLVHIYTFMVAKTDPTILH